MDLLRRTVTVGKSKTAGGEGRVIPLSATLVECLQQWRSNFPEALPAHYVFPSERYGLNGDQGRAEGAAVPYAVDPLKPIGSWRVAWTSARKLAGVTCRWHDMRHSFVSRMAEWQVSDATIMALSGHLSRKMLTRYSHVQGEAKRRAISMLDTARDLEGGHNFRHTQ
jgi:integrase